MMEAEGGQEAGGRQDVDQEVGRRKAQGRNKAGRARQKGAGGCEAGRKWVWKKAGERQ
jgi:hypothetical protein